MMAGDKSRYYSSDSRTQKTGEMSFSNFNILNKKKTNKKTKKTNEGARDKLRLLHNTQHTAYKEMNTQDTKWPKDNNISWQQQQQSRAEQKREKNNRVGWKIERER